VRFFGTSKEMGIDLGTANTLIYIKGKGIVLREPSVVAINTISKKVLAVGLEAKNMIGRTPENIVAFKPLKDGVIANFDMTHQLLESFIKRVTGKNASASPKIVIGYPLGVTDVEKRAITEATTQTGARKVMLIEEPLAAAIGAGLPVNEPIGSMVVDIGGGTTEVAIVSLGAIVVGNSLRVAGYKLDEAIINYVKREFNLLIGERTAENIKIDLGCVYDDEEIIKKEITKKEITNEEITEEEIANEDITEEAITNEEITEEKADKEKVDKEVIGRDLLTGLPKVITITKSQIRDALKDSVALILGIIKTTLEEVPPELAGDIMDKGIMLTGGGALLKGLDKLIYSETHIPTYIAEFPLDCVALGTGKCLDMVDKVND